MTHIYDLAGYYAGDSNSITKATVEISEFTNGSNFWLYASPDPDSIGSVPDSGTTADYAQGSAITEFLVDQLLSSNPGLSFAWSALGLINSYVSAYDETEIGDQTRILRAWNYSPTGITDASEYFWFESRVAPYQNVSFHINYKYRWFPNSPRDLNLTTVEIIFPSTPPGYSLTAQQKLDLGIEEIPIAKIQDRAASLGISQETVNQLKNSGESTAYFAHNIPVIIRALNTDQ
jgi:hypothetical protein